MFHKKKFIQGFQADFRKFHMGKSGQIHLRYTNYNGLLRKANSKQATHLVYEGAGKIRTKIGKFKAYGLQQASQSNMRSLTTPHRSNIHPVTFESFTQASGDLDSALSQCSRPVFGVQALHVFVDKEHYVWGCFLVCDTIPVSHGLYDQMGGVGIWWNWLAISGMNHAKTLTESLKSKSEFGAINWLKH